MLVYGLKNILVKIHETAHFKCLFNSSTIYTFCEWRNDNGALSVSTKYQFSTKAQSDPLNPNPITCSLDVLNLSVDDVGNYFCIAYYDITSGSTGRKVQSNPGQTELELAGI